LTLYQPSDAFAKQGIVVCRENSNQARFRS
jgi:hypothetical protein